MITPPLTWIQATQQTPVELTQKIELGALAFAAGTRFRLIEALPLESVPALEVTVQAVDCPAPQAKAEMTLILPEQSSSGRDPRVGVQLEPACTLEIYIENADLENWSFFRPTI